MFKISSLNFNSSSDLSGSVVPEKYAYIEKKKDFSVSVTMMGITELYCLPVLVIGADLLLSVSQINSSGIKNSKSQYQKTAPGCKLPFLPTRNYLRLFQKTLAQYAILFSPREQKKYSFHDTTDQKICSSLTGLPAGN